MRMPNEIDQHNRQDLLLGRESFQVEEHIVHLHRAFDEVARFLGMEVDVLRLASKVFEPLAEIASDFIFG